MRDNVFNLKAIIGSTVTFFTALFPSINEVIALIVGVLTSIYIIEGIRTRRMERIQKAIEIQKSKEEDV